MRLFLNTLVLILLLTGRAPAQVPNVVADIPPVHSLVAAVMGDLGRPTLLTKGLGDPHSQQLRPSQARALATADLVFWIGPALTPWLEAALASLAPPDALNMPLLSVTGTNLRWVPDDPDALDPHAWHDPENASGWLTAIAAALSDADPDNRTTYSANATAAAADLDRFVLVVQGILTPAKDRPLIFAHDAFGYFADRFELRVTGVLSDTSANKPGAAHLKDIKRLITSGSIACVFGETQQNPALLHSLTKGVPVPVATLDPIGFSLEPGPALYGNLIQNLATEIGGCIND